jgi:hypothetical protein
MSEHDLAATTGRSGQDGGALVLSVPGTDFGVEVHPDWHLLSGPEDQWLTFLTNVSVVVVTGGPVETMSPLDHASVAGLGQEITMLWKTGDLQNGLTVAGIYEFDRSTVDDESVDSVATDGLSSADGPAISEALNGIPWYEALWVEQRIVVDAASSEAASIVSTTSLSLVCDQHDTAPTDVSIVRLTSDESPLDTQDPS